MSDIQLDTLQALPRALKEAVKDLLFRMADDKLILGHRDTEWTGLGPILEEDIAFSSMAQDKLGHAHVFYGMLHEMGEADADTLAFGRTADQFRCASIVELSTGYPEKADWALAIVRQFLFSAADEVRLSSLVDSTLKPLADVARKLRGEVKYHLMHGRTWMLRLGRATADSRSRLQDALDRAYPRALGLFEPTDAEEALAQSGICPRERELQGRWESAVVPVLKEAGLRAPQDVEPGYGGRSGRHSPELAAVLEAMSSVYSIDPDAKW